MKELTDEVIHLFNERITVSSKKLQEKFGSENLSKVLANLVKEDKIRLDALSPSVWILINK